MQYWRETYSFCLAFCIVMQQGCGSSSEGTDSTEVQTGDLGVKLSEEHMVVSSTGVCVLQTDGIPVCQGEVSAKKSKLFGKREYTQIAVTTDTFCGLRVGGFFTTKGTVTCVGPLDSERPSLPQGTILAGEEFFCASRPQRAVNRAADVWCWGHSCENKSTSCWYAKADKLSTWKVTEKKDGVVVKNSVVELYERLQGDNIEPKTIGAILSEIFPITNGGNTVYSENLNKANTALFNIIQTRGTDLYNRFLAQDLKKNDFLSKLQITEVTGTNGTRTIKVDAKDQGDSLEPDDIRFFACTLNRSNKSVSCSGKPVKDNKVPATWSFE